MNKALSLILTAAMLIVLLPAVSTPANAEDGTASVSTYSALTDAISKAASGDTIEITADIVVEAEISLSKNLTINGNGHTISVPVPGFNDSGTYNISPSAFRVFDITSGTATITNATIKGGAAASMGSGIYIASDATLHLKGVTVSNSGGLTNSGGGLCNDGGTVYLENCNVIRNGAMYGGGFLNCYNAKMFVENCSFSENRSLSSSGGGGAGENQAYLYVNNSTFSNNKSTELGGAINNCGGTADILNSTFTGNVNISSSFSGGAIRNSNTLFLINDIFAYNYSSTDGISYTLNDFDPNYWNQSGVTAYDCVFHGSTFSGTGSNNTQYADTADGSSDTLFTGGSTSTVLAADGFSAGVGTIYQPYLAKAAGSTTTSVPLKSESTALSAGTQTAFTNGDGTPVIGYYNGSAWVELTSTSYSDLSQYQVTTDQNGITRAVTPAIGAVESVVSSLCMVKVNKAAEGGTVVGGSIYGDTYASGDSVTLTAVPDSGYIFSEWDDAEGVKITSDNPYSFTASNVTVTPVFATLAAGSYVITYIGNGNISGAVLTDATTIADNTGNLAKTGYVFDGWNTRANGSGTAYAVNAAYTWASSLTLYAQWTESSGFTTTVNVTLDGSTSSSPVGGDVELWQGEAKVYTASGAAGVYTASAVNGTYDIYINSVDTGTSITINNAVANATINYYTVSFAVSDAGTASDSTISATAGGTKIESGDVVLAGKTVVITASGAGADSYTYAWSGTGLDDATGKDTETLTLSSLSGKADAACAVTGTTTASDTTAPASPTYSPTDSATDVAVDVIPTLTFGEALYSDDSGTAMGASPTGVIKVYKGDSNEGDKLTEGSETDNSHFTVAYNSATDVCSVTFGADLNYSQSYYIELQADTAYDAAGNAIDTVEGVIFTTMERPTTYSVTLNTNGGNINSGDVTSYTHGIKATLPTDVTKEDLTFAGWYANKDFSGSAVTEISAADTGNKTYYALWLYNFSGTISSKNAESYNVNAICLTQDNTTINASVFDNDSYSFEGVPEGYYNLVMHITVTTGGIENGIVVTKLIHVNGSTNGNIVLPKGLFTSKVTVVGANTPIVEAGKLDELSNAVGGASSDTVMVELKVEKDAGSANASEVNAQISENGKTTGLMLDIDLTQTITPAGASGTTTNITDLSDINDSPDTIEVIIHLPTELQGKNGYAVYRYHDSKVQTLTKTPNGNGEYIVVNAARTQITAYLNKFSTYAVATADTNTITLDANGGTLTTNEVSTSYGSTVGTLPTPTRSGYKFAGWYTSDGVLVTTDTVETLSNDYTLYAEWTKVSSTSSSSSSTTYSITVSSPTHGSISPSGTMSVKKGVSKTFTITPDEGYVISDVLVDGVSVGAVSSYTFRDISGNHTLTVIFAEASGLPYYYDDDGNKVFIGFAANKDGKMNYIAPDGETVLFQENPKIFTDISGHWAKSYIDFVTEREIFLGTGGNTFSPDSGMTRAMFATVIGRLYERSYGAMTDSETHAFSDCDYAQYYGAYIDWCAENGIITGVGGGLYEPNREITRQEMAAILYRFADFLSILPGDMDTKLNYSDTDTITDWAENAALYCQTTGIITGRVGGIFAPVETATRAEVAVILERLIENTLD